MANRVPSDAQAGAAAIFDFELFRQIYQQEEALERRIAPEQAHEDFRRAFHDFPLIDEEYGDFESFWPHQLAAWRAPVTPSQRQAYEERRRRADAVLDEVLGEAGGQDAAPDREQQESGREEEENGQPIEGSSQSHQPVNAGPSRPVQPSASAPRPVPIPPASNAASTSRPPRQPTRCSRCDNLGHARSNKNCPRYDHTLPNGGNEVYAHPPLRYCTICGEEGHIELDEDVCSGVMPARPRLYPGPPALTKAEKEEIKRRKGEASVEEQRRMKSIRVEPQALAPAAPSAPTPSQLNINYLPAPPRPAHIQPRLDLAGPDPFLSIMPIARPPAPTPSQQRTTYMPAPPLPAHIQPPPNLDIYDPFQPARPMFTPTWTPTPFANLSNRVSGLGIPELEGLDRFGNVNQGDESRRAPIAQMLPPAYIPSNDSTNTPMAPPHDASAEQDDDQEEAAQELLGQNIREFQKFAKDMEDLKKR